MRSPQHLTLVGWRFDRLPPAPLVRDGVAIGVISVSSPDPGAMSDKQMALLATFADQAVIAIENVRLFNETKEALEQQQASGEVLAAISSSIADATPVFDKILDSCERLLAGKVAGINLVGEDGLLRLRAYHGPGTEELERVYPLAVDAHSGSGVAISTRSVIHYPDVVGAEGVPETTRRACKAVGFKGIIFAPMVWEGTGIGAIYVGRDYVGPFSEKDIALLKTFATQSALAIQNARLFREIGRRADSSRPRASTRASSSPTCRTSCARRSTPSSASRKCSRRGCSARSTRSRPNIWPTSSSRAQHLLSLINDILDLSKIEAGRMELEPTDFDLPAAIENTLILVRERAHRRGIALGRTIDERLGCDPRRRAQGEAGAAQPAVERAEVHAGGRTDRRARGACTTAVRRSR